MEVRKGSSEIWREVACMAAAVVINFCGGLRGEGFLLAFLDVMFKFWEEKRQRRNQ